MPQRLARRVRRRRGQAGYAPISAVGGQVRHCWAEGEAPSQVPIDVVGALEGADAVVGAGCMAEVRAETLVAERGLGPRHRRPRPSRRTRPVPSSTGLRTCSAPCLMLSPVVKGKLYAGGLATELLANASEEALAGAPFDRRVRGRASAHCDPEGRPGHTATGGCPIGTREPT